jgi:hypothetical protein
VGWLAGKSGGTNRGKPQQQQKSTYRDPVLFPPLQGKPEAKVVVRKNGDRVSLPPVGSPVSMEIVGRSGIASQSSPGSSGVGVGQRSTQQSSSVKGSLTSSPVSSPGLLSLSSTTQGGDRRSFSSGGLSSSISSLDLSSLRSGQTSGDTLGSRSPRDSSPGSGGRDSRPSSARGSRSLSSPRSSSASIDEDVVTTPLMRGDIDRYNEIERRLQRVWKKFPDRLPTVLAKTLIRLRSPQERARDGVLDGGSSPSKKKSGPLTRDQAEAQASEHLKKSKDSTQAKQLWEWIQRSLDEGGLVPPIEGPTALSVPDYFRVLHENGGDAMAKHPFVFVLFDDGARVIARLWKRAKHLTETLVAGMAPADAELVRKPTFAIVLASFARVLWDYIPYKTELAARLAIDDYFNSGQVDMNQYLPLCQMDFVPPRSASSDSDLSFGPSVGEDLRSRYAGQAEKYVRNVLFRDRELIPEDVFDAKSGTMVTYHNGVLPFLRIIKAMSACQTPDTWSGTALAYIPSRQGRGTPGEALKDFDNPIESLKPEERAEVIKEQRKREAADSEQQRLDRVRARESELTAKLAATRAEEEEITRLEQEAEKLRLERIRHQEERARLKQEQAARDAAEALLRKQQQEEDERKQALLRQQQQEEDKRKQAALLRQQQLDLQRQQELARQKEEERLAALELKRQEIEAERARKALELQEAQRQALLRQQEELERQKELDRQKEEERLAALKLKRLQDIEAERARKALELQEEQKRKQREKEELEEKQRKEREKKEKRRQDVLKVAEKLKKQRQDEEDEKERLRLLNEELEREREKQRLADEKAAEDLRLAQLEDLKKKQIAKQLADEAAAKALELGLQKAKEKAEAEARQRQIEEDERIRLLQEEEDRRRQQELLDKERDDRAVSSTDPDEMEKVLQQKNDAIRAVEKYYIALMAMGVDVSEISTIIFLQSALADLVALVLDHSAKVREAQEQNDKMIAITFAALNDAVVVARKTNPTDPKISK